MDDREKELRERERQEEEDRKREQRLQEERESAERLEAEYQRRLEAEELNMAAIKNIQEEVGHLNKSLNACINIAAQSIANAAVRKRCATMHNDNYNYYLRANQTVDTAIDITKDKIERLSEEKDEVTEQRIKTERQIIEIQEEIKERQNLERLAEA